jgi:hypothetical protein
MNNFDNRSRAGYLIVSRGARTALDIAPASAPLANSLISLLLKNVCSGVKKNSQDNQLQIHDQVHKSHKKFMRK